MAKNEQIQVESGSDPSMKRLLTRLQDPAVWMLFVALIIGILLRFFNLGGPIGGYHGYNEAFYSNNAIYYLTHPITELFTSPVDINNPPLTNFLIYLSYLIFGVSEWSGRFVMALTGIGSIAYAYLLSKALFNKRVAAAAALLIAVSPGFLLIGRNIQTDSVFIFFILAGLYHFIQAKKSGSLSQFLASSTLFGLAMLSKIVTAIVLILLLVLEIREHRGISFLKEKNYLIFIGLLLVLSVPWFLYQTLTGTIIEGQSGLAANAYSSPNIYFFLNSYIQEPMWGISPALFALLPLAIYVMFRKRSTGDLLILSLVGLFLSFYMFFHFHSYYMVPYIPFALIGIARALEALFSRSKGYEITISLVAVISTIFAVLLMSALKYGHSEFAELPKHIPPDQKNIVIETSEGLWGSYHTIIRYYLPNVEVLKDEPKDFPKDKTVYYVDFARPDLSPEQLGAGESLTNSYSRNPVVFGKVIAQNPVGSHFLRTASISMFDNPGPERFGFASNKKPGLIVVKVSDPSQ